MTNDIRTIDRFDGTMAEIYGQFAENEQTGLKKGVYWSVLIRCNPIQYMDCKWSPMILIDWMPVDTLANTPAKVVAADCPGAEASFFIASHDAAPSWSIEINQTTGAPARVDYALAVDFEGLENENIKALPVIGSAPLARLEFVVPRDSIFPKPNSHEDARNVVAPFFAGIANWVDLPEEDADGWPVKNPQHYRFTPPPPTD
ncbi:MAG: hypothetical protein AAFO75_13545 [Pseudomonadota bacterium]